MNALGTLLQRWSAAGLGLLAPESALAVEHTFVSVGSFPTSEILAMYSMVGGMLDMNEQGWRLWSLKEIEEENTSASPHGVLFSDYLIDCWRFRVKPIGAVRTEVYLDLSDKTPPKCVARSLPEFFSAFLKNPDDVLVP